MAPPRLAVLADLHGNLPALEAVLAALPPVDGYLVGGDVAGGPWQNEVVERLRGLAVMTPMWAVLGNGDDKLLALLNGPRQSERLAKAYHFFGGPTLEEARADPRFAALRWFADRLSPAARDFLEALPETARVALPSPAAPIRLVHGSPAGYDEVIVPRKFPERFNAILARVAEPVLACAHSHEPWSARSGGKLAFNPGAVSCPLDGRVGAQFAVLTWSARGGDAGGRWEVNLRHIDYETAEVERGYRESGVLEAAPPAAGFLRRILRGATSAPVQEA